jgi:hypothetical protein
VSVLDAVRSGAPCSTVTVSTYKHCRDRAYLYATGERDFLEVTKGPKTINFFHNLLDPTDPNWVTIDGHMVGAWRDLPLTMRDAIPRAREYQVIKDAVLGLSADMGLIPNQLQATLWFVRKRILNVLYDPQGDLFYGPEDTWRTLHRARDIRPYPRTA